jgi:hypothetical protein
MPTTSSSMTSWRNPRARRPDNRGTRPASKQEGNRTGWCRRNRERDSRLNLMENVLSWPSQVLSAENWEFGGLSR